MPEFAFIQALSAFLAGPAGLTPAPVQVGGALPSEADQAPAVVLALQSVRRLRGGLGEGAETVEGILAWTSRIDLASPFLPGEPDFSLISDDRRTLTLPHGGLIRADGLDGALGPADITVSVAGALRTLVAANPNAGQFTVDALTGQLTFGAALPASGEVVANYHLSQWERLAFLIAGELRGYGAGGGGRRRGGANRRHRPRARRAEPARRPEAARTRRGRRDRDRRRFARRHARADRALHLRVRAHRQRAGLVRRRHPDDAHHHKSAPPAPRRGDGCAGRGHDRRKSAERRPQMSESIGEMIIPGTYIEVRAEGLIGVGGISTGNIGVVGTANRGPVGEAVILGCYSEALSTFGNYDPWPDAAATPRLTLTRALEQVFRGGGSSVYAVRVAALPNDVPAMRSMVWRVRAGNNATIFSLTATSPGTWANSIVAELTPPSEAGADAVLTLTLGATRETFRGPTAGVLAQEINDASNFRDRPTHARHPGLGAGLDRAGGRGRARRSRRSGGDRDACRRRALPCSPPSRSTSSTWRGSAPTSCSAPCLVTLRSTETEGNERIAIMGGRGDTLAAIAQDAQNVSNGRAVLVAPGIRGSDAASDGAEVDLPAAYSASLLTGRLASIAPHVSLTNKDVAADGLTRQYTRAEQKQLLLNRVLVLIRHLGIRVLRGLTTETGPFRQISVRRIVDYAKAGVRIGANPYIGRLNNARVRAAMKATLDGFLSQMVLDEMLISYELEVNASRAPRRLSASRPSSWCSGRHSRSTSSA